MKRIVIFAGARPNFMKVAPILRAASQSSKVKFDLVHTGQHYDDRLSKVFFDELGIPEPAVYLSCSGTTHAEQTASVMVEAERYLKIDQQNCSAVVVVGDVNSTLAAALAAAKLNIPVVHVEAGLRSRDRSMPEEINRLATDSISDLLLASEPAGYSNLLSEGRSADDVVLVGNVMIDTLLQQISRAVESTTIQEFGLKAGEYAVVTIHRPSNVDSPSSLSELCSALVRISQNLKLILPLHPRTRARLGSAGLDSVLASAGNIIVTEPLGYVPMLSLTKHARLVITDSGGIQEETTALSVPCLTLRENTERPITISEGKSTLVGNNYLLLEQCIKDVSEGTYKIGKCPHLWDGLASNRIVSAILQRYVC